MKISREPQWVSFDDIEDLELGDLIRFKHSVNKSETYQVVYHHGSHVTAVASVSCGNPPEWEVLVK